MYSFSSRLPASTIFSKSCTCSNVMCPDTGKYMMSPVPTSGRLSYTATEASLVRTKLIPENVYSLRIPRAISARTYRTASASALGIARWSSSSLTTVSNRVRAIVQL